MLAEVSALLAWLGVVAAAYGAGAAAVCLWGGRAAWGESARRATLATAALLGAAWLGLTAALLANRFEVVYVAAHSGHTLPVWLKIAAAWGGQEGSLLTWAVLQAGVAAWAAAAGYCRAGRDRFGLWTILVLDLVTLFFAAATMCFSNPFVQSTLLPADGSGLNPLLRHVGMALHPPALFLGYVALAVPFALALAGILTGEEARWRSLARPWALAAWLFLGLGLLLGARWAYDVLGWGGYWGWDPVENAALMPWLTATALLHVLSRGGAAARPQRLGGVLAMLSFVLVVFGTFATRSGALASVHAYARSNLSGPLLALMAVAALAPLVAAWAARRRAAAPVAEHAPTWRDHAFGLTVLLLLTLTASIWIGTVLPSLTEWLAGWRMEAGPEWFDRVTGPQWALLLLLMGVCPLLGSAAASVRRLRRSGIWLLAGGAAAAGAMAWAGWRSPAGLVGACVAGMAGAALLGECAAGAARVRRETGLAPGNALLRAVAGQRRRYGGHVLHLGVVFMALGIIGTRIYPAETTLRLERSAPMAFEGYQLVLDEVLAAGGDDYSGRRAAVSVYADDRYLTTLYPELRTYPGTDDAAAQTQARPALRVGWREDVYLALTAAAADGQSVTVHAALNRLVNWLWLGGLLLLAGGTLALSPAPSVGQSRVRRALRLALAAMVALLFVAAGVALWGSAHGAARAGAGRPLVGAAAPGFRLTSFEGETVDLAGLRGQVVVVNFWASWCPSCEASLPALERVWQDYGGRGVVVVGIASGDTAEAAQSMVARYGLSYALGLDVDGAGIAGDYGLTGVPETFVVDGDGRVAALYVGAADEAALRAELDALLGDE